ncbi:hypothetical protein D5S17_25945 [Pseudonocardiaceae bacterium YIM PH 21723]|nr:hypothetical protein D5S17_25945 [Pseudonocardiaceae bacterium YIM PH 21723]
MTYPDLDRPGVDLIRISRGPASALDAARATWHHSPGLLSITWYRSLDGTEALTYEQWAADADLPSAPLPDSANYRIYRGGGIPDAPEPGVLVLVSMLFDPPGVDIAHRWIDLVFEAVEGMDRQPGSISGHFHVSLRGDRMINYALWTTQEAHAAFLTGQGRSEQNSELWDRVRNHPGTQQGGFTYFRPL